MPLECWNWRCIPPAQPKQPFLKLWLWNHFCWKQSTFQLGTFWDVFLICFILCQLFLSSLWPNAWRIHLMEKGLALTYGFRSGSVPLRKEHGRAEVLAGSRERMLAFSFFLLFPPGSHTHSEQVFPSNKWKQRLSLKTCFTISRELLKATKLTITINHHKLQCCPSWVLLTCLPHKPLSCPAH